MPVVFIGSSVEQKELALEICTWLEEVGCEARIWTDTFDLGDQQLFKLMDVAQQVDGAVFVFGDDDEIWYRGDKITSPRDNVVLEFGLFSGVFGNFKDRRSVIVRSGNSKIPSDLAGFTYDAYSTQKRKTAESNLRKWAKGLKARVSDPASITLFAKQKKDLFLQGTQIIAKAGKRVKLFAKTPVPIVGPRPYDSGQAGQYAYEKEQFEAYWRLINNAASGGIYCAIGCSIPCLAEEIRNNSAEFKVLVLERIRQLYLLSAQVGSNLNIFWSLDRSPATFVVGDDDSLLWFKGHNSDNVWIHGQSTDMADALATTAWRALREDEVISQI